MINKLNFIVLISFLLANSLMANSIYRDNNDGTVTDVLNYLLWQQAESDPMNWEEALFYCENLFGLGGKTDWRLPNIKELQSLTNYTAHNPAININRFPGVLSSNYWSSTTYVTDRSLFEKIQGTEIEINAP